MEKNRMEDIGIKRLLEIVKLMELPDKNVKKFKTILTDMGISTRTYNGDLKPMQTLLDEVLEHKADPVIAEVKYTFLIDENDNFIKDGQGDCKKEIHIKFEKDNCGCNFSCDYNDVSRLKSIISELIKEHGIKHINVECVCGHGVYIYKNIVDFNLGVKVNKTSYASGYIFENEANYR